MKNKKSDALVNELMDDLLKEDTFATEKEQDKKHKKEPVAKKSLKKEDPYGTTAVPLDTVDEEEVTQLWKPKKPANKETNPSVSVSIPEGEDVTQRLQPKKPSDREDYPPTVASVNAFEGEEITRWGKKPSDKGGDPDTVVSIPIDEVNEEQVTKQKGEQPSNKADNLPPLVSPPIDEINGEKKTEESAKEKESLAERKDVMKTSWPEPSGKISPPSSVTTDTVDTVSGEKTEESAKEKESLAERKDVMKTSWPEPSRRNSPRSVVVPLNIVDEEEATTRQEPEATDRHEKEVTTKRELEDIKEQEKEAIKKVTTRPPVTASPLDERRGADEERLEAHFPYVGGKRRGRQQSLSPRGEPLPIRKPLAAPSEEGKASDHIVTSMNTAPKKTIQPTDEDMPSMTFRIPVEGEPFVHRPTVELPSNDMVLAQAQNIKIAQDKIIDLEKEIESLRFDNDKLTAAGQTLNSRNEELTSELEEVKRSTFEELKQVEKEKEIILGILDEKEKKINQLLSEKDHLEARLESNFRKIRVRERELENRLELARVEHIAINNSKDEVVLDLKRQIEQLSLELENFRNKGQELNKQLNEKREALQRTVKTLRLALIMLESGSSSRKSS